MTSTWPPWPPPLDLYGCDKAMPSIALKIRIIFIFLLKFTQLARRPNKLNWQQSPESNWLLYKLFSLHHMSPEKKLKNKRIRLAKKRNNIITSNKNIQWEDEKWASKTNYKATSLKKRNKSDFDSERKNLLILWIYFNLAVFCFVLVINVNFSDIFYQVKKTKEKNSKNNSVFL